MVKKTSLMVGMAMCCMMLCNPVQRVVAQASDVPCASEEVSIEYLENGEYIETVLTVWDEPAVARATNRTKSATKTSNYKDSSGTVLWSVSVTASFQYNGSTSSCTNASGTTHTYSSDWSVSNATVSRSGNSATASATGTKSFLLFPVETKTMSVTVRCDANGNIS